MSDEKAIVPRNEIEPVKYCILQETNGEECESWYYFIKYQGNEKALKHLEKQLDSVEWYTLDDLSTFVIDTENLVSEQTAKEMIRVDLNYVYHHRKFDGVLQEIDLGFKDKYDDEKKMIKAFDKLGYGQIERYIDKEDIPSDAEFTDWSDEDSEDSDDSDSSESSESEDDSKKPRKKKGELSDKLKNIPKFALSKIKRKK